MHLPPGRRDQPGHRGRRPYACSRVPSRPPGAPTTRASPARWPRRSACRSTSTWPSPAGPPVDAVVLSGPGARTTPCREALAQRTGLTVSVATRSALGTHTVPHRDDPYRYTVAAGLAHGRRQHEAASTSSRRRRRARSPRRPPTGATRCCAVLGRAAAGHGRLVFTKNQVTDRKQDASPSQRRRRPRPTSAPRAAGLRATSARSSRPVCSRSPSWPHKRFDWERLMRELALVLPERCGSPAATRDTPPPPSSDRRVPAPHAARHARRRTAAAAQPHAPTIEGCAQSQQGVAEIDGAPAQPVRRRGREPHRLHRAVRQRRRLRRGLGRAQPPAGGSDRVRQATTSSTRPSPSAGRRRPARASRPSAPSRLGGGA